MNFAHNMTLDEQFQVVIIDKLLLYVEWIEKNLRHKTKEF